MSAETVLQRLRLFLLGLTLFIFAGTMVELWLTEHTETMTQLIPFGLSGLGIVAIGTVLIRPQGATVLGLRLVMGLIFGGGLFGVYEHLAHNLAFELEIRPNAAAAGVLMDALGGANPLLAPGILALAALLALAATYYHPVVRRA